ncbi:hypothetical protein GXB85_13100 [Cellulomonas sp. APG4]|uniref:peptidoglycan-binding protein n=1 Tax=Cellulomonas sp. APG4 TaxID=1538656 RepID=UPI00137B1AF8|nr:peptidoglycan-binding protein [Cellulomonas sp. APG4]NCT91882.1 hypothetical protein [Cellulomonas sp. APG4]
MGLTLLVVGYFVGQSVTSPWALAEKNAEKPVFATATVVTDTLTPPLPVAVGSLSLGAEFDVQWPDGAGRAVVTATGAEIGESTRSGEVLIEVSGRPMIALALPFMLYRDLRRGDSGPDVRALQGALAELGLYRGRLDGDMGPQTTEAVRALYVQAGASAPVTVAQPPPSSGEPDSEAAQEVTAEPSSGDDDRVEVDPWLPAEEIVAIPSGSATVVAGSPVGAVRTDAAAPLMTLRTTAPHVTFRASVADASAFDVASDVAVTSLGTSLVVAGTVTAVSDFLPAGDEDTPPGYDVVAGLSEVPTWADGSRVTVTPGDPPPPQLGLVVPLIAVREDDRGTYVLRLPRSDVEPGSAEFERISVEVALAHGGRTLITGALRDGDQVVVAEAQ